MAPAQQLALVFAAAGVIGSAVLIVTAWLPPAPDGGANGLAPMVSFAVLLWCGLLGIIWTVLHITVLRPLAVLAGEAKLRADAKTHRPLDVADFRFLAPLPQAVNDLVKRLAEAHGEISQAVRAATDRAEEQKGRLAAILRDLTEGVIVCNLNHQVLLYNQMVVRILGGTAEFGLGRSLFNFVTREPVLHTLDWLLRQTDRVGGGPTEPESADFVCATSDSRTMLESRMSLILDETGSASGYVLTLADATAKLSALAKRDSLLRAAIDGVRGPIANLRAAAETLAAHPAMAEEQRGAFEHILVNESTLLSDRLAALAREQRGLIGGHGAMADLHSADLLNCVIRRVRHGAPLDMTMTGLPQWLHGDSYALMLALSFLVRQIRRATGATALDLEARPSERGIYVDIIWPGEPLPSALLSTWLDAPLEGGLGGLMLRNVLEWHNSDLWSQPHRPGHARLRVPLTGATQEANDAREALPERPEFYDFALLQGPPAAPELNARPLRAATYLVFDVETTGLRPAEGDEIVSLGGVRIVNGRILTGEIFDRLVNPRRPIPPLSTKFHRITDDMVRDKPPIQVVLPQFKAFVGDAVLVAHNIAFDLSFLKRHEAECGLHFDNAILDTMLLSAWLHPHTDDHSLDGLAARYGVEVRGRHTALGDAMVTAAVLIAMFDTLESRGILTFGQAVAESRTLIEFRARQAHFATAGNKLL